MTTELVPHKHHTTEIYIPSNTDWKFMMDWGNQAIKSGLLPSAIKSPEAAAIIILKGRELGIPFMTAISNIHVISGKPCMSAELIQGLARKNLPGLVINILQSDVKTCKVEFIRPEKGAKPFVQTFTWDDAVAAKLVSKDVWKSYPAAMLWSRAVTAGLRKVCPEALMGVSYTPEEMGAEVNQEGEVIETTHRHVETPKSSLATVEDIKPKDVQLSKKIELGKKVHSLREELELTEEEVKAEIHRLYKTDNFRTLSVGQMETVIRVLEEEKLARSLPDEEEEPKDMAPWEQESLGNL